MKHLFIYIAIALIALAGASCSGDKSAYESTKKERNLIKAGNKEFADSAYLHALQYYNDALVAAPGSDPARFNSTTALAAFAVQQDENHRDSLLTTVVKDYELMMDYSTDLQIREMAAYNLGNLAFAKQDYEKSIEYYKQALRIHPNNAITRQNLLVALIKQQNDNQDQNQDQQEQEQEQEQEQQQQQQQPQPQQEVSANAEQILQTMQNRENQTREENQARPTPSPRTTDKPW